jgi:hypothetical protein
MGRYGRNRFEDYQEANMPNEDYNIAYKRVKRIKGFYVHLLIYIFVNGFYLVANHKEVFDPNKLFWRWETFSTALCWGIGLISHGVSVFGRNIFFNKEWEERKIREFIEKDESKKWE